VGWLGRADPAGNLKLCLIRWRSRGPMYIVHGARATDKSCPALAILQWESLVCAARTDFKTLALREVHARKCSASGSVPDARGQCRSSRIKFVSCPDRWFPFGLVYFWCLGRFFLSGQVFPEHSQKIGATRTDDTPMTVIDDLPMTLGVPNPVNLQGNAYR